MTIKIISTSREQQQQLLISAAGCLNNEEQPSALGWRRSRLSLATIEQQLAGSTEWLVYLLVVVLFVIANRQMNEQAGRQAGRLAFFFCLRFGRVREHLRNFQKLFVC